MPSSVMGKTFMMLGNQLLIWEKLTNPGNGDRLWERPKTGNSKAKRLSQTAVKGPVKVTWKQMCFDLMAAELHLKR